MGSGPATPVKGRPGSRGSGRSPSSDAGWLLRRPPGPFAGRPARACRQDRSVLRGVPRPVWLPPAVPSSVIGSRANLGPHLPPLTSVSFLQMRRVSPRVERCNKKPRVPTSRGRSTEPRLPPALPLLFLQLVCPGAGGHARVRGEPPSCAEPGMGAHVSTHAHAHTCTHTHAYAHTHRTLCAGLCVSGGSAGCSLRGTCSLHSLPPGLSALQEIDTHPLPAPTLHLPHLPGASSGCGPSNQALGSPPSPAPWPPAGWAFSEMTLWSSNGREANCPQGTVLSTQWQETFLQRDFLHGRWMSELLFSFLASWWPGTFCGLARIPGFLPDQLSWPGKCTPAPFVLPAL
ncbi:protein NATD1 isoform X1 [Neofelis nebulosa]|uniref:protein NATD1 isoform X1 n=1 Tax=Neofelis nebulosa TaxID=61452 RepID=UPI00272DBBA1|nr:protein NATD1 isoform X1 [Neofelis nebulosa]XP_058559121.1 protein NATD1 isoform X1 [Neofelis nebulosa]